MSHHAIVKSRLLRLSGTAILGLTLSVPLVAPVYAQSNTNNGKTLEEVTVTGTRIKRKDYISNSPIVTVDSAQLESQSGLNLESYLNQLPQYNPATTPVTTQQDVQITPVNSVGISTISLRGFGANRSLVLVDGKRTVPINALMVTDVNSIPSAMIQRVETITGGASAVYGADAVGGVTNFILRDNFQGMEFDGQYGTNEAGDGDEYRVSAVLGSDFSDGRGNLTVGMEYYNRKPSYNKNRDFYVNAWKNPNQGGNFIGFLQGVNGYNCAFNCPSATVANALFPNAPAGSTITNPNNYFWFAPARIGLVSTFYFNPDGSIFVNGSAAGRTNFQNSGEYADGLKYTTQNVYDNSVPAYLNGPPGTPPTLNRAAPQLTKALKYNFPGGYTEAPQERYSFMLSGHYNITDKIKFTTHASFEQSITRTLLAGNSAIFGWEADIPYNPTTDSPIDPTAITSASTAAQVQAVLANPSAFANPTFCGHLATTDTAGNTCTPQHPVPLDLAILLNSRAPTLPFPPFNGDGASSPWIPQWNTDKAFLRNTLNTNTVWQVDAGLTMDLPWKDWTGEVYFSHGESSTYNINTGNMSLARYRAIAGQPDYGANATLQGNAAFLIPAGGGNPASIGNAASTNFGAAVPIHCTSGLYDTFFGGEQRPSQDCIDAMNATLQSSTHNEQDIVEINLQGGMFDLPAGEVRGALGFQYRRNASQFTPDILQSSVSFTDQVIGVYPTGYLDAYTDAKDVYVEALVPLLKDLPFMKKLELETGARHSNYNQAPNTWTYKFLANWEVNDWLRLRGGYNRASRAPNLGELYLNLQEIFTGAANFGDPCGYASNAPWGAATATPVPAGQPTPSLAGGQTAAGAMSTYLICQAQMAGSASSFYAQAGNAGNSPGAFNWILQKGNQNLASEDADTYTAGFVATSPLSNPWLAGLQGTMDWYKVDINHAIQQYSIDYANYLCYGAVQVTNATEAAAQANSAACQLTPRSTSTGGPLTTTVAYDNLATISTEGFDFGVNWHANLMDLGFHIPGSFSASIQANYLLNYYTKASPLYFDVKTDWAGSLGPNLSGTNPGAYEYRIFSSFTYALDNWTVTLRWRHLPSVTSAAIASQKAIMAYDAGAPANQVLSYTPSTSIAVKSYDVLDMAFTWAITDKLSLRGGIDNIGDFAPEVTAATAGYPGGTNLEGVCANYGPGCQNPTAYSLPSPGAGITNAGFYDTLGRRFFVGLKAKF